MRLPGRVLERRVAAHLGEGRGIRARDRAPARHCLERRLPEPLVERREDERARAAVERDELVARHAPTLLDAGGERVVAATACEDEAKLGPLRAQERERLEQPLVVLVRPAPRRVEEERLAPLRARAETRVVDPVAIAAATATVLDDPAPWVSRGLARAAEFTWRRTAAAYEQSYRDLL